MLFGNVPYKNVAHNTFNIAQPKNEKIEMLFKMLSYRNATQDTVIYRHR